MKNQPQLKGKAVVLPETENEHLPVETPESIKKAQELARSVSSLALSLFEAKSTGEN